MIWFEMGLCLCQASVSVVGKSPSIKSGKNRLEERFVLIAPIEKSHASLAQFRTETKYASVLG
jgi:hypothetical protein